MTNAESSVTTKLPPLDDPRLLVEWFAIAWSKELLAGKTLARRVMNRDLVLWRGSPSSTSREEVHCWLDLCIHRGAKLSLGTIRSCFPTEPAAGNYLVCPYHGWSYAESGQCVAIPAHPGMTPPAKACATTFAVQERYGIVWVQFGTDSGIDPNQIPDFPPAEQSNARVLLAGPYRFRALGPRLIENLLDVAHLGIVHAGLLGDPTQSQIEDYEVAAGRHGPVAKEIRIWQPDPDGTGTGAHVAYHYEVYGPLTAGFVKTHGDNLFGILAQVVPIDEEYSEMRMAIALNYGHHIPSEELIAFQDRVVEQDRAIVESQRPELLPLDLQAELHLRSDRLAIAYRKWLREIGFTYGVA